MYYSKLALGVTDLCLSVCDDRQSQQSSKEEWFEIGMCS